MSHTHERIYRLLAERVRLQPVARWLLYGIMGVLISTGIAWLVVHYIDIFCSDPPDEWQRLAWETLALRIHGAAMFITLAALGGMGVNHVRRAWVLAQNRVSGAILVSVLVGLCLTGYALYYLVGEDTRPIVSLLHWVIGLLLTPILAAHIVLGRRNARRLRARIFIKSN